MWRGKNKSGERRGRQRERRRKRSKKRREEEVEGDEDAEQHLSINPCSSVCCCGKRAARSSTALSFTSADG